MTDLIKRHCAGKCYVIGIFIVFKKAFDNADHEILLNKLDYHGVRGHKFFKSDSTNLRHRAVANGVKSGCDHMKYGVPQGRVLFHYFPFSYSMQMISNMLLGVVM